MATARQIVVARHPTLNSARDHTAKQRFRQERAHRLYPLCQTTLHPHFEPWISPARRKCRRTIHSSKNELPQKSAVLRDARQEGLDVCYAASVKTQHMCKPTIRRSALMAFSVSWQTGCLKRFRELSEVWQPALVPIPLFFRIITRPIHSTSPA
jgi:hypothetical protein